MQLNPRENFVIARGLEDHRDSTVYYVRATVRNGLTDALIDTIVLENSGDNHRYSETWQTPADPSGEGFYIVVTTSVYTDSGYTTKATNYGDKYDTYLVQQRVNPNLGGIGGGGADIDYKRVRSIIQEELEALHKKMPKMSEPQKVEIPDLSLLKTNLSPVLEKLDVLLRSIGALKIPDYKEPDLKPMVEKIEAIRVNAANPVIEEKQLKPLFELLEQFKEVLDEKREEVDETCERADELIEKMKLFFSKDIDTIVEHVGVLKEKFENVQYVVLGEKKKGDDV